jgi:hypothetical protein
MEVDEGSTTNPPLLPTGIPLDYLLPPTTRLSREILCPTVISGEIPPSSVLQLAIGHNTIEREYQRLGYLDDETMFRGDTSTGTRASDDLEAPTPRQVIFEAELIRHTRRV